MKFLYVPWRSRYLKDIRKTKDNNDNCPFCLKINETDDEKNYILGRYKYNFIVLNLHPYNAGHIMVLPLRHICELNEMNNDELQEFISLISISTKILKENLNSEGINVGMNLGKAAGAGIPSHMHMHIIPRWIGDTNFLPLIAQTKTISIDINKTYNDLKLHFDRIEI